MTEKKLIAVVACRSCGKPIAGPRTKIEPSQHDAKLRAGTAWEITMPAGGLKVVARCANCGVLTDCSESARIERTRRVSGHDCPCCGGRVAGGTSTALVPYMTSAASKQGR